ncbi:MAG: metal ABC transporter substrate-binding protein [Proteobacteria bacterium]|nr:metal ABC transporter substrate-binding protein [Pseudomonadota bacterium]MBU1685897.1 metal ABC transporter substrate-binding protein [Pseudomonadota bacterium]
MIIKRGLLSFLFLFLSAGSAWAEGGGKLILCSTFPITQTTRNVTAGTSSLQVDSLISPQLGCPHDYALTPKDMRKLAKADVLIINGLGMEEFLGAPLARANPGLVIIDSSRGISGLLQDQVDDKSDEADDEHRGGFNPHLFASPVMTGLLTKNIAEALEGLFPEDAELFRANYRSYGERMNRLAADFTALGRRLGNNRIITQHGVFDYLARDLGLEVVGLVQVHPGSEPSAAGILSLIRIAREQKVGAIFTEPQYSDGVGRTIANETGVPSATLDPAASGPENAPLEYYETVMRRNLEVMANILGTRE